MQKLTKIIIFLIIISITLLAGCTQDTVGKATIISKTKGKASCTETGDSGNDYSTVGTVSGTNNKGKPYNYTDYCKSDQKTLYEYSCNGTSPKKTKYVCPDKCINDTIGSNGHCGSTTITQCIDSDNGFNLDIVGTCKDPQHPAGFKDKSNGNYVDEYYCQNNSCLIHKIECSQFGYSGNSNGICITKNPAFVQPQVTECSMWGLKYDVDNTDTEINVKTKTQLQSDYISIACDAEGTVGKVYECGIVLGVPSGGFKYFCGYVCNYKTTGTKTLTGKITQGQNTISCIWPITITVNQPCTEKLANPPYTETSAIGLDIYTQETTTTADNVLSKTDECASNTQVTEYSCVNNGRFLENTYDCGTGYMCSNGACVATTTN